MTSTNLCRTADRFSENSPTHTPKVDEESSGCFMIQRRANIVRIKSSLTLTMSNRSGFTAELKTVSNKLDALIAKIDSTMTAIAGHSPQHNCTQGWSTSAALVIIVRKIARAA